MRRIVDLVKQIQVLILPEDVRQVGHQLETVAGEWAITFLPRGDALAGKHNRTHLEWSLAQIRHVNVSFERSHVSGLILTHHELEVIQARRQCEAGGVLHILLSNLLRFVDSEFDRFAHIADIVTGRILNLADYIERGFVAITSLNEWDL